MNQSQMTFLIWIGILLAGWLLLNQFYGNLFSRGGKLAVVQRGVSDNTLFMHWEGPVQPPMYRQIRAAFQKYKHEKSRIVLSISSRGGLVGYGGKVIRLLQQIRQTHSLETVVLNGKVCASMCVPVYLQGQQRIAGSRSRFMFHEVKSFDPVADRPVRTSFSEKETGTDRLIRRYFQPAGLNPDWLRKTRAKMRGKDYWVTGKELVDSRSGVVHRTDDYAYANLVP